MNKKEINFKDTDEARNIAELLIHVINELEENKEIVITQRNCKLTIQCSDNNLLIKLEDLYDYIQQLREIDIDKINSKTVMEGFNALKSGDKNFLSRHTKCCIQVGSHKANIFSRTIGQQNYIKMISESCITLCIGPAGTGKTYIAIAKAVNALLNDEVSRIILTRPAIEAGENLGFLPGDLKQKIDPYIRPLYDALHDMLSAEILEKYMDKGIIEVAPLAYMRGRTLNNSFVILDEAQNTSKQQMLMFLTRLGYESKCIITGDPSQIDLPNKKNSGLIEAYNILDNIDNLGICKLTKNDVVRHPIVEKIIEAYNKYRSEK
ncbi:MAG: PhoH family protein [Pontiellaceae bacterium]